MFQKFGLKVLRSLLAPGLFVLLGGTTTSFGYPLDAFEETAIPRLEGYFYSLRTDSGKRNIPLGARLSKKDIGLRLKESSIDFTSLNKTTQDPNLRAKLLPLLKPSDSLALLDISSLKSPRLFLHNADTPFSPASVGKLLVAIAVFEQLRAIFPYDTDARKNLLRTAQISADTFANGDSHVVPFWNRKAGAISFRPIEVGDQANLYTYLDWMLSASSNAAASMVMRELIILAESGKNYPSLSIAEKTQIFNKISSSKAHNLLLNSQIKALEFSGINSKKLQQGGFFTRTANTKITRSRSVATTRELLKLLVQMERGKLIDSFSSIELKRLLYLTQGRSRYAAHESLADAAIYYKSGSLYRCKKGGCVKNEGTSYNYMHSLAVIESPAESPETIYLLALSSNDPGINSAERHEKLAGKIHQLIRQR